MPNEYTFLETDKYRVRASYGGLYGYVEDVHTGTQLAFMQGAEWTDVSDELDNVPEHMQNDILSQYEPD